MVLRLSESAFEAFQKNLLCFNHVKISQAPQNQGCNNSRTINHESFHCLLLSQIQRKLVL